MTSGIIKFLRSKICVQVATYWGNPQKDAYGNMTYDDPIEVKCRWDDTTQLVRDDTGKEVASKAQVQILQDLKIDSWLYFGLLSDFSSPIPSPEDIDGAYKIIRVDKNPLFGSTNEFVRTVYL